LYERSFEDDYINFQKFALQNTITNNSTAKDLTKEYISTVLRGIEGYLTQKGEPDETHLDSLTAIKVMFCLFS